MVSKLNMALKGNANEDERNPVCRVSNPCSNRLVDSCITFVTEEQKMVVVQVDQAVSMWEHSLIDILSDIRSRAQVASSLAARVALTRYSTLYSLIFFSRRKGDDLSFTMESHIITLAESKGLISNFQLGETLWASSEGGVVLADRDCPAICALRAVMAYIFAARWIGWGLTTGHLFSVVPAEGGRGRLFLSAAHMTANLQR